jgi:hypothetical protein
MSHVNDMDRWIATPTLSVREGAVKVRRSLRSRSETPVEKEEGLAGEAVTGNGTTTLILKVDASKLIRRREPKSQQNRAKLALSSEREQ